MALRDHVTPRVRVPLLGDNSVDVRGLNLDDFTFLLGEHLEAATEIAEQYAAHKNSIFSSKPFQDFVLSCARDFPGLVTEVISIACDEPDAKDIKLSLGFQLSILHATIKLTMEEAGGLGNLIAQLRSLAPGMVATVTELGENRKARRSRDSIGRGANR